MSANRFANHKLSEQELFIATLFEPKAIGGMPNVLGERMVGGKYPDGSMAFGARIEYFGKRADSSAGTPAELETVKLDWNINPDSRTQALPHTLRKLTTKPEQKGWLRTTSEDSVTVRLGELSITGLFGAETDPSIRVEGSVEAVAEHKRVIEKLIARTIIDDVEVSSPGVIMRYNRSNEAAKPLTLSPAATLIGYVQDISNYQPGQNVGELIRGISTPVGEPVETLQNVA